MHNCVSYNLIIIFPECNHHFNNVTYFKDTTLSPKCYMTNHSSVVELTCPDGFVFAENGARTVQSECVCRDNIGYTAINATCLRKFLIFEDNLSQQIVLNGGSKNWIK